MTNKEEQELGVLASVSQHDGAFEYLLENTEENLAVGRVFVDFRFDVLKHGEKKSVEFI